MSAWKEWQAGLITEDDYKADCDLDDWRQKMNNNDLWLREKQLERYAQEIKAYCESQNGDCRGCYFGKPPKEDEIYSSWDCKFNADQPEDWEVE